jgi:hypothetical protein
MGVPFAETRTVSGSGSAAPTNPTCPLPETMSTADGVGVA